VVEVVGVEVGVVGVEVGVVSVVISQFSYSPRPHLGDHFPCRPVFPAGGSHTHFEPRHMDGLCFPHRGSCPTRSNGEVQSTIKTSSSRMVKYWIS
jgi:hypothetical protein